MLDIRAGTRNWSVNFIICGLLFSLMLVGGAAGFSPVAAQEGGQMQPLPAAYYGSVTVNGEPAPAGLKVSARRNGQVLGEIGTGQGTYGGAGALDTKLIVPAIAADQEGSEISFYIDNVATGIKVQWYSGDVRQVDLALEQTALPPPPPPPLPPPSPPTPSPVTPKVELAGATPAARLGDLATKLREGSIAVAQAATALVAEAGTLKSGDTNPRLVDQRQLRDAVWAVLDEAAVLSELTGRDENGRLVVEPPGALLQSRLAAQEQILAELDRGEVPTGMLDRTVPIRLAPDAFPASKTLVVRLAADRVNELQQAVTTLAIQTPIAEVNLPVAYLAGLGAAREGQGLEVMIEQANGYGFIASEEETYTQNGGTLKPVGQPVQVAIVTGAGQGGQAGSTSNAEQTWELALPFDPAAVPDPELLGLYRYNSDQGQWEHLGNWLELTRGRVKASISQAEQGSQIYALLTYEKTFSDLKAPWYREAVEKMAGQHLVRGVTVDSFEPDATITRAEFSAILTRALGLSPDQDTASRFRDVPPGSWFSGVVGAAARAGIVRGTGAESFEPLAPVSRQEIATMLYRAEDLLNLDFYRQPDRLGEEMAGFHDVPSVAGWALPAVSSLVDNGILQGYDRQLYPVGRATRAEAAVLIYRWLQQVR